MVTPISRGRGARSPRTMPSPIFVGIVVLAVVGGVMAWTSSTNVTVARIGVFILVLTGWVVSLCLHEFLHAYLAWRHGDRDVETRGYLRLDPLKYSHPFLSLILPLIFIALGGIGLPGGAVYLHTGFLPRHIRLRIALAGPAANLLCAVVLLAAISSLGLDDSAHRAFWFGLSFLAFLQVMATILNLVPVPGLDGYGALEPYLKPSTQRAAAQLAPFGMIAVFVLLTVPGINSAFFGFIYWLFELSGVPRVFSSYGYALFRFWEGL